LEDNRDHLSYDNGQQIDYSPDHTKVSISTQ
jgi:hypothetical protein